MHNLHDSIFIFKHKPIIKKIIRFVVLLLEGLHKSNLTSQDSKWDRTCFGFVATGEKMEQDQNEAKCEDDENYWSNLKQHLTKLQKKIEMTIQNYVVWWREEECGDHECYRNVV